jgi:hypothetical protein
MKKTKTILVFGVLIGLFSCAKELTELNSNSIVNENGQISKNLAKDPLFVKFDKANYEMSLDLLKYSREVVDVKKSKKLNNDFRNKKFKTIEEFAIAKEKIGFTDFYNRSKRQLFAIKTREELYAKYPELQTIPAKSFFTFYYENRKYKITSAVYNNHLDKLRQKRKSENLK